MYSEKPKTSRIGEDKKLKQIGMSAGTGKNNVSIREPVNQKPITLRMAFGKAAVITGKVMFPIFLRQRISPNDKSYSFIDFIHIPMALFHEFEVFFELIRRRVHTPPLWGA
jgi:hypothetical protein